MIQSISNWGPLTGLNVDLKFLIKIFSYHIAQLDYLVYGQYLLF